MLTLDEKDFLGKILKDKKVTQIADKIIRKVRLALPNLEIKHMEASALGISGQGDIDIYVFSPPDDFDKHTPGLIELFGNPKSSKQDSIAWKFELDGYEVELYLTDPASKPMQRQIAIFEALQKNKSLRKEYEKLKEGLNGKSFREYQRKKYEFYHKILGDSLSPDAQKVQKALKDLGYFFRVKELPQSTRTSAEAASAIGCKVGQIAKSLIFKGKNSHQPILVIASGVNRVNEEKLGQLVDEPIEKADADFVYKATGFAIGGIPPVGHKQKIQTFIDKSLLSYEEIWAAAGTPHAVFKLSPNELVKITGGQVVSDLS